jgi:hypothetical protein
MATLENVWGRLFAARAGISPARPRRERTQTGVRRFANEDILFYIKHIDNRSVVREADPAASGRCWKLIGSVVGAAVLLIGVLMPGAYGLLSGYQIQSLRQENERLAAEQASLELQESQLLSPARMEQLAREQQFVDPAPQKVVYLEGRHGSLALNK